MNNICKAKQFIINKLQREQFFSCITARISTRVARRVSLMEQELLTSPEHLSSLPVVCRVYQTRSFWRSLFVLLSSFFWPFGFVCSIYRFWLWCLFYTRPTCKMIFSYSARSLKQQSTGTVQSETYHDKSLW